MKYSIIIPVYNCERYLEECVSSLLQQKVNCDYEIILVNDGSSDNSGNLAEKLANKNKNVRVLHKANGGAASARNLGICEAKGKYLLFVDGDDTVENHLLEIVEQALTDTSDYMIIYGMSFDYYCKGEMIQQQVLSCNHSGLYYVDELMQDFRGFFLDNTLSSACNKVFSAEIIKENHLFFDESMTLYEDFEFVLRYMHCISTVMCIGKPLYHYRHDKDDNHLNQRVAHLGKLKRNLSALLNTLDKYSAYPQLTDTSVNLYMQLLISHLLVTRYTTRKMQDVLCDYCDEKNFREMLNAGAKLGIAEKNLLEMIDSKCFSYIKWEFAKRRWISNVKRQIKKILRK